ncbi:MAG: dihydroneopterin aldolase [Clostridiales bacterium]|jgi:dihydroneopterin aldolase|nr:dihydroneopterin aldolase [Clostridiales bacterium]
MDQIILKGLRVHTHHGITSQEKSMGQELEIDVTLDCDLSKPCVNDNPEDTISRKDLVKLVSDCLSEGSDNLMEYVAQETANAILRRYPQVVKVEIELKQAQAPIYADYDYLSVHIIRPISQ